MSKSTRAYMHPLQASLNHRIQATYCGPPSTKKHQSSSQKTCSTNNNCKTESLKLTAKLLKIHLTPASLHTAFEGWGIPDGEKPARDSNKQHSWESEYVEGWWMKPFTPRLGTSWLAAGECSLPGLIHVRESQPLSPSTVCRLGN